MPNQRPDDPKQPGKVQPEQRIDTDQELDEHVETEEEQAAMESEKAFDLAITRIPPG